LQFPKKICPIDGSQWVCVVLRSMWDIEEGARVNGGLERRDWVSMPMAMPDGAVEEVVVVEVKNVLVLAGGVEAAVVGGGRKTDIISVAFVRSLISSLSLCAKSTVFGFGFGFSFSFDFGWLLLTFFPLPSFVFAVVVAEEEGVLGVGDAGIAALAPVADGSISISISNVVPSSPSLSPNLPTSSPWPGLTIGTAPTSTSSSTQLDLPPAPAPVGDAGDVGTALGLALAVALILPGTSPLSHTLISR
jgi:hypothetical protein